MTRRGSVVFDWDRALLLFERGWKFRDIAAKLGCAYASVQKELKARGAQAATRKHQRTACPLGPKLYATWRQMQRRCERSTDKDYAKFGGRGIGCAAAWRDFDAFYDWAIAAGYTGEQHLDRADRSGNFTPENCRWVVPGTLRVGVPVPVTYLIEAFGERKSCPDWTRDPRCRIGLIGLYGRLASGWPPEEALTAPSRSKPSRRIDPVIVPETRPTPHRVDWPAAVALYEKEQLSEDEIARRFGVTQGAVIRGLRLRGVKRRMPVVTAADRERQRLRRTWLSVHERCDNPHDIQYPYMGARGIRVSPAWRDFKPFHAWALAMGARPGVWLVRKDSRGHWSPENCEWVRPEVARHRERPHGMPPPKRYVTAFGETKGVSEWSKDPRCTVRDFTISRRLDKGWRPEDAISGPPTNPGTTGLRLVVLRAFGEEKSKREWLCDPRCGGIGHVALDLRLRQGWSAQDAISTPPWRHPAQASAAAR